MNVCHIISGDLWAGAEAMANHLCVGLKAIPGIEPSVIILNQGILATKLELKGVAVHVFDEARQSFPAIAFRTVRTLRMSKPDILHAHGYKQNILAYLVSLSIKKKVALVNTQHGLPEVNGVAPGLQQRLIALLNNHLQAHKFSKTIAVSMEMKDALIRQYRLPDKNIQVIHNGIDVPPVVLESKSRNTFVIGSAGRLFPVKDYPFMVEIAARVVKSNNRLQFELAGDGPMGEAIQGFIQGRGLEKHFALRGFVADISAFYRNLDIYLNTSIHEGIPISVLEAMANGIPVVAPAVGGLTEIITDGKDGFLVEERNPEIFAARCLKLLNDESLRRNMGAAARDKILREYSIQRMANHYAQMYGRLKEGCQL